MSAKPNVEEFRHPRGRDVHIDNVYEADGVSGYSLYDPDNAPYEVTGQGKGGSLDLSEQQARIIHERLGEIIEEWDKRAVAAFMKKRPQYVAEHVRMIARECGVAGLPFCGECKDWHGPQEPHSEEGDVR